MSLPLASGQAVRFQGVSRVLSDSIGFSSSIQRVNVLYLYEIRNSQLNWLRVRVNKRGIANF